jgi:hypothetical protein
VSEGDAEHPALRQSGADLAAGIEVSVLAQDGLSANIEREFKVPPQ